MSDPNPRIFPTRFRLLSNMEVIITKEIDVQWWGDLHYLFDVIIEDNNNYFLVYNKVGETQVKAIIKRRELKQYNGEYYENN